LARRLARTLRAPYSEMCSLCAVSSGCRTRAPAPFGAGVTKRWLGGASSTKQALSDAALARPPIARVGPDLSRGFHATHLSAVGLIEGIQHLRSAGWAVVRMAGQLAGSFKP